MIYNIYMNYILIIITSFFSLNISSKELIIDVFGKEEVKTYVIDENNFFRMVTTQSVFKIIPIFIVIVSVLEQLKSIIKM